jgi:hypothetical protein
LPPPDEKVSVVNSQAPAGPSPSAAKGGAGFAVFKPDKRSANGPSDVLQLSASLFSVAQRRSVAVIDMQYSGDSIDEARSEFIAALARLLPAVQCKGWDSRSPVDAERIRSLAQQ